MTEIAVAICAVGDESGCGPTYSTYGSATVPVTIRRRIVHNGEHTDCFVDACELRLVSGNAPPIPLTVTDTIPTQFPTVVLNNGEPPAANQLVDITGFGFEPERYYAVTQCAGFSCASDQTWLFSDQTGALEVARRAFSSEVAGIDCLKSVATCTIWVSAADHLDELVIAPIDFSGEAIDPPSASIEPEGLLEHRQTITVTIENAQGTSVSVTQCVPDQPECVWSESAYLYPGETQASIRVSRRIGTQDCAEVACVLVVQPDGLAAFAVDLAFDPTVPPPPLPSMTITPNDGLVDLQAVTVDLDEVDSNAYINTLLCTVDRAECRQLDVTDTASPVGRRLVTTASRLIGGTDCAFSSCEFVVRVNADTGWIELTSPARFDPDAPLAPPETRAVLPNRGLWNNQRVEIRTTNARSNSFLNVRQCADDGDTITSRCTFSRYLSGTDGSNARSSLFAVQRTFSTIDGTSIDCLATSCSLLIQPDDGGYDPIADNDFESYAISFSPTGDTGAFPEQLECVAWPDDQWPVGELPAGITESDLDALAGSGSDDGSMVVIYGGEVVYEHFDAGVDRTSILPSFSVAKSFTSTFVGMIIDDGLLDLDGPAPVPQWADPDDPRHQISVRNLLHMASGLDWDESYNFADPNSDIIRMLISDDAGAYVADKALVSPPGTNNNYSTGTSTLLANILSRQTGLYGDDFEAFMFERLLTPLGIENVSPSFDPTGVWHGGSRLNMATLDFARLGLLYLRGGTWNDEQLLPDGWAEFVRTPSPASSGYGAQFWINGGGRFSMVGIFGQQVHIAPDLDLVVAVNNGGGSATGVAQLFESVGRPRCSDAPIATDDTAQVELGEAVTIDVLQNDEGAGVGVAPETLTLVSPPAHGDATVSGNSITYRSTRDAPSDSLSYLVCTIDRSCAEAQVELTVRSSPERSISTPMRGSAPATRCALSSSC